MRLSIAALIVAAAGPRVGGDTVEVKQEGIAIVITIDISSSMLAEDFAPSNRLAVAKRQAVAFIRGRTADRIGLVAFAGEALTQVPVTLDYPVIEQAVMDLKIGSLEDGTAIGSGLATAVNRLRRAPDKSKVVLLLTDGENNRGLIDPRTAAATAAAYGIKVYTIGVGTIGEAPIPTGRGLGGFRYELLPVRIDEPLLREIASKTGGRYFRAKDSEALSRIFRQIDELEKIADPGDPLHEIRGGHPAPDPPRARGAGARAGARQHAGGARPMMFDAPLLLLLAPALGLALGFGGLARPRAAHPARAAVVPGARAAGARARHLGAARPRPHRARGIRGPGRSALGPHARSAPRSRALSLVFAMDISRSMLAEDASPNRLQRSIREARRLIQDLEGDRLGLIAFAGRSYILAPLTVDGSAIRLYLDALDPDLASEGGSDLSSVLAQGGQLLGATTDAADRVLVVFTDGEAHDTLTDIVAPGRGAEGGGRPPDHGGRGDAGPVAHPHPGLDRARSSNTSGTRTAPSFRPSAGTTSFGPSWTRPRARWCRTRRPTRAGRCATSWPR